MKATALGLKLVYSFINFIIPLPVTCKYIELLDYFSKKLRGTAEVNDAFKLLCQQLNYRRLYCLNLNATSVSNSYIKELL